MVCLQLLAGWANHEPHLMLSILTRRREVILGALLLVGAFGCQTPRREQQSVPHTSAEEFPLGKLAFSYPSFRTLAALKEWGAPLDETEGFYLFEKGNAKAAVVRKTWGSGDHWNVVVVYAFDDLRTQWVARAFCNTEAQKVRVAFDRRHGVIQVHSGKGESIFSVNIAALTARRTTEW